MCPPPAPVHLWLIPLVPAAPDLAGLLDAAERRRLRGFADPADRLRYVTAHGAVRLILGGYLGRPPESLRWGTGERGKPELAGPAADGGLTFNLSAAGDLAVLGVTRGRPIGVDVARIRVDAPVARWADRFFPPGDRLAVRAAPPHGRAGTYHRLWVRKEAWAKAYGLGVVDGIRVPVAGGYPAGGRVVAGCRLVDVPAPGGYVAAVGLTGAGRVAIGVRRWPTTGRVPARLRPPPDPCPDRRAAP